jgi:hypothetical protein
VNLSSCFSNAVINFDDSLGGVNIISFSPVDASLSQYDSVEGSTKAFFLSFPVATSISKEVVASRRARETQNGLGAAIERASLAAAS